MLFELVDRVNEEIQRLERIGSVPPFADCLRDHRPELFAEVAERLGEAETRPVSERLAAAMLDRIADIPTITTAMRQAIDARTIHPAVRCAMVGAMAYLVQPRDLIPDSAPGGFGYVDDCMILRTTVSEYFDVLPQWMADLERERLSILLLAMCVPPRRLAVFQGAVDGVWHLFQRLLALPPLKADEAAEELIRDPLAMRLPVQGPTPPYGPGPDIERAPGGGSITLVDDKVRVAFPDGGELLL